LAVLAERQLKIQPLRAVLEQAVLVQAVRQAVRRVPLAEVMAQMEAFQVQTVMVVRVQEALF
jgi:hypothetical protein